MKIHILHRVQNLWRGSWVYCFFNHELDNSGDMVRWCGVCMKNRIL